MILLARIRRNRGVGLAALLLLAALMCGMRLLITRHADATIGLEWPDGQILGFRMTAMLVGAMVGCGLATSGVALQALLRNPLAEPFILGLSSGAGLGVMASMYAAYRMHGPTESTAMRAGPAIGGALLVLLVVYGLGRRRGWLDPVSLVLVGVIVSAVCGAGIMFFQHMVPAGLRGDFTLWLMGNIPEAVGGTVLWTAGTIIFLGLCVTAMMGRAMDAATLGDDEARSVGVSIGPLRTMMFVLASVLAAITVAIAGPIGFVGLVGPHAARLVLGPKHGTLAVGAALMGVVLVVGSDVARQAFDFGAGRMPIGIFTALLGGPAFLWLLLGGKGQA